MTDDQIREMANRFLSWKLPADFSPDGGISYEPFGFEGCEPTGTNLFTASQAEMMVRHMLG